jgi:hypothetical protein
MVFVVCCFVPWPAVTLRALCTRVVPTPPGPHAAQAGPLQYELKCASPFGRARCSHSTPQVPPEAGRRGNAVAAGLWCWQGSAQLSCCVSHAPASAPRLHRTPRMLRVSLDIRVASPPVSSEYTARESLFASKSRKTPLLTHTLC